MLFIQCRTQEGGDPGGGGRCGGAHEGGNREGGGEARAMTEVVEWGGDAEGVRVRKRWGLLGLIGIVDGCGL